MIFKCPYCNKIFTKLNLDNTRIDSGTFIDTHKVELVFSTICYDCGHEFYVVRKARLIDND